MTRRALTTVAAVLLLAGWLPAPAAAATLSGTVTSQGQPVSGVRVFLQRMPGFQFVDDATTDAAGHYSIPPVADGTYRVEVDPQRGPFVPQAIEALPVSGNTVRNFQLAQGVTLSGEVRDPDGQLVPWAFVGLQDAGFNMVSWANTRTTGRYSLGAPPGTYRLFVDAQAFIQTAIEGLVLPPQGAVRNIALERGRSVQGRVVDEDGAPMVGVPVRMNDPLEGDGQTEVFRSTAPDGTFMASVVPGRYIVTADPLAPYHPVSRMADARTRDVTGLTLRVTRAPARFVPDDPPRAALIRVSAPGDDGLVTVTGQAGAVAKRSHVFLVTLDTGHLEIVTARADGSFRGVIWAPRGGSIMVKADPFGETLSRLVAFELDEPRMSPNAIAGLVGTIVTVPGPPAAGGETPFGGGGLTGFVGAGLPAWAFQGTVSTRTVAPNGSVRIRGTLSLDSPALVTAGPMAVDVRLTLEKVAGADGRSTLATHSYASTFFTPTGLPIERQARFWNHVIDQFRGPIALVRVGRRATAEVDITLPVGPGVPAGRYRPRLDFHFQGVPVEAPPTATIVIVDRANRRFLRSVHAPIVKVGKPAAPRLFSVLLLDTLSNGSRGVVAREDRGKAGVALRILTRSETFVVPRVDRASGAPLRYRLEPFLPIVSVGDQAPPNPPLVPFRFPSGSLTVTVRKPDGKQTVLGPAPIQQARFTSPVDRQGNLLDGGGGHVTDAYQLTTLDPAFEVTFDRDGKHTITLDGSVVDRWGTSWALRGTYEVWVADRLVLDTAVLPGTPFEVGDVFNPGLVVTPPRPADVEVRVRLARQSKAADIVERVFTGQANRFGHFQTDEGGFPFPAPGEYRVDVTARYRDKAGRLWMGTRTWGGVVAPRHSPIAAHGRRGIDSQAAIGPQWFRRTQIGIPIGGSHVPFPFASGDVHWAQKSDSAIPLVAFQDPGRSLSDLLRGRALSPFNGNIEVPIMTPGTFDERTAQGETPLFSSRPDGIDGHIDPAAVDLWAYSYRSVQRPLVRVREEIGEDALMAPYWRFHEQYSGQVGVGEASDQPGEIKFQYAGVALHGPALATPRYAIYGSLFVLVPDDDPRGGTRTFPPFQGNPGGVAVDGGPIVRVGGRDVDLFLHLTGVRPGTVLEVGDTFALAGAVGPPLPARVKYTVTRPDGTRLVLGGRANRVGYFYDPADDFAITQPGVYTVKVTVTFDGQTSAGQVDGPPFPTGDVLGTAGGVFHVFAVERGSPPLAVNLPARSFLTPPAGFEVKATAPAGVRLRRAYVTTMMPGTVLESLNERASGRRFDYRYDPAALGEEHPTLDTMRFNRPLAADHVTVTLFGKGEDADGKPVHAAQVLVLHGHELFGGLAP